LQRGGEQGQIRLNLYSDMMLQLANQAVDRSVDHLAHSA
jgi:hypothetical protein